MDLIHVDNSIDSTADTASITAADHAKMQHSMNIEIQISTAMNDRLRSTGDLSSIDKANDSRVSDTEDAFLSLSSFSVVVSSAALAMILSKHFKFHEFNFYNKMQYKMFTVPLFQVLHF